ncbi:DegT/DnrJ/EryC1/StrS family aminotransferase [Actinomyces sp. B33]|uniref:DegT/DnrJ/EryC1/StrS family aminotransferase n=1 Tax=Actinomyces sp. B33 TaxID=2942131 RepID=UPI00234155EA|nr:DegT/DnrJ/EryC1/StrS family aminotransferase [Actinomyces sp. B33]MDC4232632.1 DegT/DnrJ/EryC1/StrS family aminotransferase [Actinomyces sp. B33]
MTRETIPAARPLIGEEEIAAVARVMRTGMLAQGPEVAAFEEEFARRLVPGALAIAVNSGTSALHLGLLAAGIGPGDEVVVPSFTFAATANAVALTGAAPVFADIDPDSFCLDPASVDAAITGRTRAIMPVHLYGHPADMKRLGRLADARGLLLVEDAAQAHGALLDGRAVGSFGAVAAFSLYPTKNMTSGEGGMVTTRDERLARRVRLLRNQGMQTRYANELVGFNNRMTDVHAAIGRVQLTRIDEWTRRRRANAAALDERLTGVAVPPVAPGAVHVYHQYTIRIDASERDRFAKALRDEWGVGTGVYYPTPCHRLPSLEGFAGDLDLPETDRAAREVVSLPVHPSLTPDDLDRIVEAVNACASAGA